MPTTLSGFLLILIAVGCLFVSRAIHFDNWAGIALVCIVLTVMIAVLIDGISNGGIIRTSRWQSVRVQRKTGGTIWIGPISLQPQDAIIVKAGFMSPNSDSFKIVRGGITSLAVSLWRHEQDSGGELISRARHLSRREHFSRLLPKEPFSGQALICLEVHQSGKRDLNMTIKFAKSLAFNRRKLSQNRTVS